MRSRATYKGSEIGRGAGLLQFARNGIELGAAGITSITDYFGFKGLQYSAASMRGIGNLVKSAAMNGGAGYFKNLGMKIAFGTAAIGVKLAENAAEQSSQEFIESVFTDVWLNIAGAQNKDASAMFEDGVKEGVMAVILSPFLFGQAYIMTSKGKLQITDEMRAVAQKYMGSLTSEAFQNPETVAKIIDANASEMTIETLTNGALSDVDTSVVEQTQEEVKAAEQRVTGASEAFTGARMQYADEMQKYADNGEVISDADHDIWIQTLENAGKLYQSAKNTFASLSEKLKQAQGGLDRLIAGIITSARAEGKVKAQADILSEMAARRMEANMEKADEVTEATVRVDQPPPENVSNEGDPLAQDIESVIMEEGKQGEFGNGAEGTGEPDEQKTVGAGNKGKYIGSTDDLTSAEKQAVNDFVGQGKTVIRIPRDPKAVDRTPDFSIDGVKTELKTLENANTNTGMKRIQIGFSQGAETVILDARNSGLTSSQANEIIDRAAGKYPNKNIPGKIEIWIDDGKITYP